MGSHAGKSRALIAFALFVGVGVRLVHAAPASLSLLALGGVALLLLLLRRRREHPSVCVAIAVAGAAMVITALPASAAYIDVHGSPGYTPGSAGFVGANQPVGPGSGLNDAGTGVGYAYKYDTFGVSRGPRGIRWDGAGAGAAVELGNLGAYFTGNADSAAYAINAAGTAVGYASNQYDGFGQIQSYAAVRWDAGTTAATALGNLGANDVGATRSFAHAVNAAGTAVGISRKYEDPYTNLGDRAVRWDAGGTAATELGNLGTDLLGVTGSFPYAVNASGTAVGYAEKYDGAGVGKGQRAVRWDGSGTAATELGDLGTDASGATTGRAVAVNTAGTAVGYAQKYDGTGADKGGRAVRWNGSGTIATELGNLGLTAEGVSNSFAHAVNSAGTAVGAASKYVTGDTGPRAVRWDAGGTAATELGHLGLNVFGFTDSTANAVNSTGIAVGYARDNGVGFQQRAVYWGPDGLAIDLNTLIDPASGWSLRQATAVSDTGWISGFGYFDPDGFGGQGEYGRLFSLQVPEPGVGGLALLGLAAPVLLRRRAQRNRVKV